MLKHIQHQKAKQNIGFKCQNQSVIVINLHQLIYPTKQHKDNNNREIGTNKNQNLNDIIP